MRSSVKTTSPTNASNRTTRSRSGSSDDGSGSEKGSDKGRTSRGVGRVSVSSKDRQHSNSSLSDDGDSSISSPTSSGQARGRRQSVRAKKSEHIFGDMRAKDIPPGVTEIGTKKGHYVTEEEMFLHILDLLEEQDEFDSMSDAASEADEDQQDYDFGEESENEEDEESDIGNDDSDWKLQDWELDAAWSELQERRIPRIDVCMRLVRGVIKLHSYSNCVVQVPKPDVGSRIVIVGDLHGHFGDLMHILTEHGEPQLGPGGVRYVFNGDFVDRGTWGPEVLLALYCLKLKCPQGIFLNRGNHEDQQQNLKPDNGFVHSHCTRAFGSEAQSMYRLCRRSFKELPLCHVVAKEISVIHGGLPLDPMVTLQDIDAIDRRRAVPIRHVSLLGYPRNQKVIAKRDLVSDEGEKVMKSRPGRLIERVGKSNKAIVRFSASGCIDEVVVRIAGAPELEEDIEIVYESEAERQRHRSNRLFVSMLWSDPVDNKSQAGPSKRGAGSYFDERITQDFLRVNKLRLLVRSHEKRADGFAEEHRNAKNGLMAATVFSASNYPGGAGEPAGNAAAVIVFTAPPDGQPLASTLAGTSGWREPYDDQAYSAIKMTAEMREKFNQAEAALQRKVSARARALSKLRELTYCGRPKLLSYWQRGDVKGTGLVDISDWARAMRACIIPDDDFPWEWLTPFMLKINSPENSLAKKFNYAAYLANFDNLLSRKLSDRWHGGAINSIAPGVTNQEEALQAWAKIDRNGDGRLSYQELRPILRGTAVEGTDKLADEDRVYSVLAKMDKDRTGYVDRHEFIQAVLRSLETKSLADSVNKPGRGKSRTTLVEQELATWSEKEVAQCWAATQGAIRALAATTGCASSVFEVLDGDSDGVIDRSEFQQGLLQLLRGSPLLRTLDQWEPLLWKLVDEDGSGFVSPDELNLAFSVRECLSL